MQKLMGAIILGSICALGNAQQPEQFIELLRTGDSEQLAYLYLHDDECPWTASEAEGLIEGIITRSRIRPLLATTQLANSLYLDIDATCLQATSGSRSLGYVVYIQVMFGNYPWLYSRNFGGARIGGEDDIDYLLDNIKTSVESAMTVYVEVNFLSED